MSLARKWVLTLFVLGLILIAIVLIVRVSSNDDELASGGSSSSSSQITAAQYDQIQAGMTTSQVTQALGEPDKKSESQGGGTGECWYYGASGGGTYEVCFEGETVASKSGSGVQAAPAPIP